MSEWKQLRKNFKKGQIDFTKRKDTRADGYGGYEALVNWNGDASELDAAWTDLTFLLPDCLA